MNHITIKSPFTEKDYEIRQLDPHILTVFSKPETGQLKQLRIKITDLVNDLELEKEKQKTTGITDQQKIEVIEKKIEDLYLESSSIRQSDKDEMTNRKGIIEYGCINPKIQTMEDYVELGADATWLYTSIVNHSQPPKNYTEVILELFQARK